MDQIRREDNRIFGSFLRFNTADSLTVATVGVLTSRNSTGWGVVCFFLFFFLLFYCSLLGHQYCILDSIRLGSLEDVSLNLCSAITHHPLCQFQYLFELQFNFSITRVTSFPHGSTVKNPPANTGDTDLISG